MHDIPCLSFQTTQLLQEVSKTPATNQTTTSQQTCCHQASFIHRPHVLPGCMISKP
jgi:hypothetical protein